MFKQLGMEDYTETCIHVSPPRNLYVYPETTLLVVY